MLVVEPPFHGGKGFCPSTFCSRAFGINVEPFFLFSSSQPRAPAPRRRAFASKTGETVPEFVHHVAAPLLHGPWRACGRDSFARGRRAALGGWTTHVFVSACFPSYWCTKVVSKSVVGQIATKACLVPPGLAARRPRCKKIILAYSPRPVVQGCEYVVQISQQRLSRLFHKRSGREVGCSPFQTRKTMEGKKF